MLRLIRSSFFSNSAEDEALEARNLVFWEALLGHIEQDLRNREVTSILDVGCHHGGLLSRLSARFHPKEIYGVEPLLRGRFVASERLKGSAPEIRLLDIPEWTTIPGRSIDLAVSHEVLYLLPSLEEFFSSLSRVLRSGATAYVVLGCHGENPVWNDWAKRMQADGHTVHTHQPMDVMAAGSRAGLKASVRPLRRDGWITYDPTQTGFGYPDMAAMMEHHYRQKLLFRFIA